MSTRRKFDKKIREKEAEIQELEMKLLHARAYLQAMTDSLKLLPNEGDTSESENLNEVTVRAGSSTEVAIKVLRDNGKPMHIMDLLKAMGKEPNALNRSSVGSMLATYVRRGQLFSRTGPNTYGLVEWPNITTQTEEPPEDFGDQSLDNA